MLLSFPALQLLPNGCRTSTIYRRPINSRGLAAHNLSVLTQTPTGPPSKSSNPARARFDLVPLSQTDLFRPTYQVTRVVTVSCRTSNHPFPTSPPSQSTAPSVLVDTAAEKSPLNGLYSRCLAVCACRRADTGRSALLTTTALCTRSPSTQREDRPSPARYAV